MLLRATLFLALFAGLCAAQDTKKNSWDWFRERDYDRALEGLTQDNKLYPKTAAIIDGMGWCEYFLGRMDKAEKLFKEALVADANYKWSKQGLELVAGARKAPLEAAKALLAAGSFREARSAFADAHEAKLPAAALAELSSGEGWSLYWQALYDDAIRCFQRAARESAEHADAQRGIAWCLYAKGQWSEAVAPLKHVLKAAPSDADAHMVLAWCNYWRKQYGDAVKAFDAASKLLPESAAPFTGLAWCAERQARTADALTMFANALRRDPSVLGADLNTLIGQRAEWRTLYSATAIGWLRLKRPTDALAIIALWPESERNGEVLLVSAVAELRLGNLEGARKALVAAQSRNAAAVDFGLQRSDGTFAASATSPQHVDGWILLAEGKAAEATRSFLGAATDKPSQVEALLGRGWAAFADRPLTADGPFKEALVLFPESMDAASGLAAVRQWRMAEFDAAATLLATSAADALAAVEKILAASDGRFPPEENHRLHVLHSWTLKTLGRRDEAKAALKRAVDLKPDSGAAHYALLLLSLEDGRHMDARSHAEAARKDDAWKNDATVLVTIAKAEASEQRNVEARRDFEAAVAAAPFDAQALAAFGTYEHAARNFVEARILLERAFWIDPSLATGAEMRHLLIENAEYDKLHAAEAWGWFARAEYQKASGSFERALKADERAPDLRRGLGLSLLRTGKLKEASEHLDKHCAAQLKESTREETWGVLSSMLSEWGWALYYAGQYADATRAFSRLATLHSGTRPGFADPQAALGWCFIKQGKLDQAKRAFLDAVTINPRHELTLQGLEELLASARKENSR